MYHDATQIGKMLSQTLETKLNSFWKHHYIKQNYVTYSFNTDNKTTAYPVCASNDFDRVRIYTVKIEGEIHSLTK